MSTPEGKKKLPVSERLSDSLLGVLIVSILSAAIFYRESFDKIAHWILAILGYLFFFLSQYRNSKLIKSVLSELRYFKSEPADILRESSLQGTVLKFNNPTDPVAEGDWEALK